MRFDDIDVDIDDGMDDNAFEAELEAVEELVESVLAEKIKHMTTKEKMDAKEYRRSASGKKAIKKYLKKSAKAGYRPDPEKSRLGKKIAALRNEDEIDTLDIDIMTDLSEDEIVSLDALIDSVLYSFDELSEACNKDESDDMEGDMDEASIHHMTAREKALAKQYRRSATGKRAISRYLKKRSRSGYRVDKTRSKMASRIAKLRRDFEEYDNLSESEKNAYDELIADIIMAVKSGEIDESEEYDDNDEEPCPECGNSPCTCHTGDDDDDDDMDEASIRHMTAKEKALAKQYRRSASGRKAIEKHLKKTKRSGYRINKELSKKMKKVAALRNEAIMESINDNILINGSFGSLNEEESQSLVEGISHVISDLLESQSNVIVESVQDQAETYINESVIPEIMEEANNYVEDVIVPEIFENANTYFTYVAESVVDDLADKKLVVKSSKSEQLEEFTSDLLDLIKDKLQIIPEQEDALDAMQEQINKLTDTLQEERIEKYKLRNEAIESKKKLYLNTIIPESVSEATREMIEEEVLDLDVKTFEQFKSAAEDIVENYMERKTNRRNYIIESNNDNKNTVSKSSIQDALEKAMKII